MVKRQDRALVLVHGATGFTGRLVCRALRRKNIRFAIAGRNPQKLALLSEALGNAEQCLVDVQSKASLRTALDRRVVVLACASPFVEVGEPMLAAAAEHGVHYVDVSSEEPFARLAFAKYDAMARASKACITPAMALEAAPADWAAQLLAQRLGGALDALDVVYAVNAPAKTATTSRGAVRSAMAALARTERAETVVRRFTMKSGERTAASFPAVESVIVPTHVDAAEVRAFRVRTPFFARALQLTRGLAPRLARAGRDAVEQLLAYASEGPDIETRASTRFEILVEARRGDACARMHMSGADPYAVTAEIQAHAAEAALHGYVDACGVVAPSIGYPALAAFANLVDVLRVEIDERALGEADVPLKRRDVRRTSPAMATSS